MFDVSTTTSWRRSGIVFLLIVATLVGACARNESLGGLQPASHRVVLARVTAMPYAPFCVNRGGESDSRFAAASAKARREALEHRTGETLYRYGLTCLIGGRAAESLELLSEAAKSEPEDIAILADLGAAQLASGHEANAAETAATVLQRDDTNLSAAFNFALALEMLSIRPAAIDAWKSYLDRDADSGWADEARAHLRKLQSPRPDWQRDQALLRPGADHGVVKRIVETFPHRTRNWIHDEWLPSYLATNDRGAFDLANTIAKVREEAGDAFLRDFLDDLSSRSLAGDFAQGIATFTAGRTASDKRDMDGAAQAFGNAAQLLRRAKCPLALLSELFGATNEFYGGKSAEALARLDALDAELAPRADRYPSVVAESHWVRGLVLARLGRSNESLREYEAGLRAAGSCREIEDEVAISTLVTSILDRIGEAEEADRYRQEVLRRLDETGAADQRTYNAYSYAAYTELAARRPHLALAFVATQSTIAQRINDSLLLSETDAVRALAFRDLARYADAERAIASARTHAQAIPNTGLRDRVTSDIAYVAGTMPSLRPEQSVAILGSALQTWRRYGWRIRTATALLARGEAYLRAGNRQLAEADLFAGIEEMEEQRSGLEEPVLRAAYFEHAESLFDTLIRLLLDENRTIDALSVAERKRARLLLDRIAVAPGAPTTVAKPLDAKAIGATLPPGVTVIEYVLLQDSLAVWVISNRSINLQRVNVSLPAINEAVRKHVDAIQNNDMPAIRAQGRWLFDRLISPIAPHLVGASTVAVIPDGSLHALPFSTLVAPDGKYFCQVWTSVLAPSASVLLDLQKTPLRNGTIVAVAEPTAPNAAALPAAEDEARQIAAMYPNGLLYIGAEITPRRFLDVAGEATLVHFAGHAVANTERGANSVLLFAARRSDRTLRLEASDIAASRLRSRPLVVLAACRTASGSARSNEGVESLATAFLSAGARGVVATMWDVDDRVSSRLFVTFHSNYRRGQSASNALRNAQLALLASQEPSERLPSVWGAPILFGAM